jgi:hypothetical protein
VQDLRLAASDAHVRADQYVYVATHAWWLATLGPHQYVAEHRLRQWVPARQDREWVLDRHVTGERTWLTGSAEDALADGYDLAPAAPSGVFRAVHGAFDAASDDDGWDAPTCLPAAQPAGSWRAPTREFLARLPRDTDALLHKLCDDNTGSWFTPFAAGVTVLRTCLVPADLRAALCCALARLPGVTAAEGVTDLDGRACLALVHDVGRTRSELMLSPRDGQFAGERDTLRADSRCGLPAGTVISDVSVTTAVVDAEGALPH